MRVDINIHIFEVKTKSLQINNSAFFKGYHINLNVGSCCERMAHFCFMIPVRHATILIWLESTFWHIEVFSFHILSRKHAPFCLYFVIILYLYSLRLLFRLHITTFSTHVCNLRLFSDTLADNAD